MSKLLKNLSIFLPIFVAQAFNEKIINEYIVHFLIFSIASSVVYLINNTHDYEKDIINNSSGLALAQLSYTQAVIMHIGEKDDRHLKALKNLINSTSETILLSENWFKLKKSKTKY